MARIAGIQLPPQKRIEVALTYIIGIGRPTSRKILDDLKISRDTKAKDLTELDVSKLQEYISKIPTEGDVRRKMQMDVKRLQEIGSYRGMRHRTKLPVRGQRTRSNARTRKGKKVTVAGKKQAPTSK